MMSVPEGFVGLLTYANMSSCKHHEHAKEHNVTSDAASLRVVYLDSRLWTDLVALDVEKAVMVSGNSYSDGFALLT